MARELGEERLGRAAAPDAARVLRTSLGHDAAALCELGGQPVVCVDATIEGVHVDLGERPASFATKAVLRTLSDLAASAATPRALLLGLRAPEEAAEPRLRALLRGVERTGQRWGLSLVGGDCTAARVRWAHRDGDGRPAEWRSPVSRSAGEPGQLLVVTGPLGGSRLGRHLRPAPRTEEGEALARAGVRAFMDVSDGLARDTARLAATSGLALELDLEVVPLHRDARRAARTSGRSALEHALNDGEDHELLALVQPRVWKRLLASGALPQARVIGRSATGSELWLLDGGSVDDGMAWVDGPMEPERLAWTEPSPEATEALGVFLGEHLPAGAVVALDGDLGAGKTTLTRGIDGLGRRGDASDASRCTTSMKKMAPLQQLRRLDGGPREGALGRWRRRVAWCRGRGGRGVGRPGHALAARTAARRSASPIAVRRCGPLGFRVLGIRPMGSELAPVGSSTS